jgi:hypothetical protein
MSKESEFLLLEFLVPLLMTAPIAGVTWWIQ